MQRLLTLRAHEHLAAFAEKGDGRLSRAAILAWLTLEIRLGSMLCTGFHYFDEIDSFGKVSDGRGMDDQRLVRAAPGTLECAA